MPMRLRDELQSGERDDLLCEWVPLTSLGRQSFIPPKELDPWMKVVRDGFWISMRKKLSCNKITTIYSALPTGRRYTKCLQTLEFFSVTPHNHFKRQRLSSSQFTD